ncbi:TetR/AcrR family transcriptional regulator [Amycolatopsis anabasis]|uniref:TetR/AcrR family transcriptional regulator n=1 Tax=Amycolatopsis anabasis TaxID=1840409 RepID=UPI00131E0C82|nr:TetR/AcrR family transcriptional regulator [Amycolatopsis anabasis]
MDPRQKLLDAAIDHLARHGVGDLSLRGLATALGTSHRMLLYHFGSKENLLIEVARAVEQRQRDALATLDLDPDLSPADVARRFWRRLTDPALREPERLFFELYGQALRGAPGATGLLDGVIDDWLRPVAELCRRFGIPEDEVAEHARLGLAVARGLLLDLVTTGDADAVNAAMERFIAAYESPQ